MQVHVWMASVMTVVMATGTALAAAPLKEWISPGVHVNGAVGVSSADPVGDLAVGHHDPTRADGSVQGLELGASLRTGAYLEGFATYALHYGASEEWEGEWEEAFLKLTGLPGGFDVRGGRMLARFGSLNPVHLHGWDFVDLPLVSGLLLGEDGLILDGGDLTWIRKDRVLTLGAIAGYGRVKTHDHEHTDEAHDAHDDPVGHAHGGWDGDAGYGRLFAIYHANDFNQWTIGVSGASGDNEQNRSRSVLGLDLTYQWRENGIEAGGRVLRWTTEVMTKIEMRSQDAEADDVHHEHPAHDADDADARGDDRERVTTTGFYSQAVWTWNHHWDTALRVGAVEREGERTARYRVSPAVTWRPLGMPAVAMRLQYNYDDAGPSDEHSAWVQLGMSWGGEEVR